MFIVSTIIFVRIFIAQLYVVNGNSMLPTLKTGSLLFTGKYNFSQRIPFTNKEFSYAIPQVDRLDMVLSGEGADKFAKEQGLKIEDPKYFYDEKRWQQLQQLKKKDEIKLDHSDTTGSIKTFDVEFGGDKKFGTVGCVALDKYGNLSAGTSTGGMTNKKWGRVGDSPIIGAGTYANNKTCGVSCTGHGEYFIRNVVAYDVSAMMEYKGLTLEQAANEIVMRKLKSQGGEGGLVAMDSKGNITMPFNTPGMYRGYMKKDGKPWIGIYGTDK